MQIKDILSSKNILEKKIKISGWTKTLRAQKNFAFIEINDGSTLSNLQIILDKSSKDFSKLDKITPGTSLSIFGKIVESSGNQKYEMVAEKLDILGTSSPLSYPLQKKRHSFEFLRTIAHLRPRTNTQGAVVRVRNALSFATHKFFQENDFFYIQTPIITPFDCEGGADLFTVTTLKKELLEKPIDFQKDFFKKQTFLTVSGQLNAEALACSMSKVYTFGPTFRSENSNTSRHLAEFWMIEPEMAFVDLEENIKIAEQYLKYIIKYVLEKQKEDISFFDKFLEKGLIKKLENLLSSSFEIISYKKAIEILKKSNKKFEFEVNFGLDLQSEHERYLTEEYFKKPLVVKDYPKNIKAFYMRENEDKETVAAMDILIPKIGEIIGGSQREEREEVLLKKMKEKEINAEEYSWYIDLRKYGTVKHSGFGLGLERLVQFVCGIENIRDTIPFPRYTGKCDF